MPRVRLSVRVQCVPPSAGALPAPPTTPTTTTTPTDDTLLSILTPSNTVRLSSDRLPQSSWVFGAESRWLDVFFCLRYQSRVSPFFVLMRFFSVRVSCVGFNVRCFSFNVEIEFQRHSPIAAAPFVRNWLFSFNSFYTITSNRITIHTQSIFHSTPMSIHLQSSALCFNSRDLTISINSFFSSNILNKH